MEILSLRVKTDEWFRIAPKSGKRFTDDEIGSHFEEAGYDLDLVAESIEPGHTHFVYDGEIDGGRTIGVYELDDKQ